MYRRDHRSGRFGFARSNTVLLNGTIYEACNTYSIPGFTYVYLPVQGKHMPYTELGRVEVCPACEIRDTAAEHGDYLCCWCRDSESNGN